MTRTLKELLKQFIPFEKIGIRFIGRNSVRYTYPNGSTSTGKISCLAILNEKIFETKEFQDFVISALNEKYERDFGEPMRWNTERRLSNIAIEEDVER